MTTLIAGIDVSQPVGDRAQRIYDSGYRFVGRYFCAYPQPKRLTMSERIALNRAGLYIVSIWESGFPTHAGYFGPEQGLRDASAAMNLARDLQQPSTAPIYFAVDYDACDADVENAITPYFEAIRQHYAGGQAIGVYGSGAVCGALSERGFADYTYLAGSRLWRGTEQYESWSVRQGAGVTVAGIAADLDHTRADGGGWMAYVISHMNPPPL